MVKFCTVLFLTAVTTITTGTFLYTIEERNDISGLLMFLKYYFTKVNELGYTNDTVKRFLETFLKFSFILTHISEFFNGPYKVGC